MGKLQLILCPTSTVIVGSGEALAISVGLRHTWVLVMDGLMSTTRMYLSCFIPSLGALSASHPPYYPISPLLILFNPTVAALMLSHSHSPGERTDPYFSSWVWLTSLHTMTSCSINSRQGSDFGLLYNWIILRWVCALHFSIRVSGGEHLDRVWDQHGSPGISDSDSSGHTTRSALSGPYRSCVQSSVEPPNWLGHSPCQCVSASYPHPHQHSYQFFYYSHFHWGEMDCVNLHVSWSQK